MKKIALNRIQKFLSLKKLDTVIAKNNNIIPSNAVSAMRISVVELPEINCSRRLSFEFCAS
ncbi:MAG: hypothetical protein RSD75_05865, partial [Mucinivorans sp.]